MSTHGAKIAWIDVISTDLSRTLSFYRELFGWTSEPLPIDHGEGYNLVRSGDHVVAGAEEVDPARNLRPVWTPMVETDDAPGLISRAVDAGGKETFALSPMLDLGRIAMLLGPWGATLGVWQPGSYRPSDAPAVPGRLVGAHLDSPDREASINYYTSVFGWVRGSDDVTMDAGLPVSVDPFDGPSVWTPVLGWTQGPSEVSTAVRAAGGSITPLSSSSWVATDPMGATFRLDSEHGNARGSGSVAERSGV